MAPRTDVEIAIIGAGVAGIATAYYLCQQHKKTSVLLVDHRIPMSYTSAQSGDNYRNWWPHPVMVDFTDASIDLMEQLALESSNVLNMTRRGYVLATRNSDITSLVADLENGYGHSANNGIRIHDEAASSAYLPAVSFDWATAPGGVDVLCNRSLIRQAFPALSPDVANIIHIRRGGDINGQQLGQYMLQRIGEFGAKRLRAEVIDIGCGGQFTLEAKRRNSAMRITAETVVNAAGPFVGEISNMLGVELPIENIFQQKLLFEDAAGAISRQLPFTVDLDPQVLDWSADERTWLAEDPDTTWLASSVPGGVHCRPEGGEDAKWVKLGWAYNDRPGVALDEPRNDPCFDPHFPEIVMRGAWALHPTLKVYEDSFPANRIHYGGYYTMTPENWPLIGPLGVSGAFLVGALSGFGSMAACAAGALCAAWIAGGNLPGYATELSLARYEQPDLIDEIRASAQKGIL